MSVAADTTRRAMWAAVTVAVAMIAQQLAGKVLRDAFFLSQFAASALPSVMSAAAILSIAAVFGSARLFRRVAPLRALPIFFGASAAVFVGEWALSVSFPKAAAVSVYLHTTSVGAVVVSGFWSVVNERFDPHTAKRVIGRIAGGATLGGAVGGLAAWWGASLFSIPTMILGLGGVNALCALAAPGIGSRGGADRDEKPAELSAVAILEETPYLRHLAVLVTLGGFAGAVYDYVLKSHAAQHFDSEPELVSFFALFYLGISLATFALQSLCARRALRLLGLAVTVGLLPGAAIGFGVLALLFPGMLTVVLARGGTVVVESSLYRSGYELLYTPLPPEKKRPTKAWIDVGADKLGAAAGAGFAFFALGIFPVAADPLLVTVGIAASVAALLVTRSLHRGYVAALAESLRTGTIDLAEVDAADATTQQTIAAIDRSTVLADIGVAPGPAILRGPGRGAVLREVRANARVGAARGRHDAVSRGAGPMPPPPGARGAVATMDISTSILELRSGDQARITAALRAHNPLPDALVSPAIALLAEHAVAEGAAAALQKIAPSHTGALLDVLLRPRTPLPVRRRVCDILGGVATERSARGLVLVLDDEAFELRFRAASALLRIMRRNASVRVSPARLFEAARTEAAACTRRWRYQTTVDGRLTQTPPLEAAQGKRVLQGVAYVFTLLLATLDREPLRLAIQALASSDGAQRGTGLEYLEHVLPADLREALWPLLRDRRLASGAVWSETEMVADLVRTAPEVSDLAAWCERVQARRAGR